MKNILRTLLVLAGLLFIVQGSYAEEQRIEKTKKIKASAAGCSAGASFAFLEVNNIRARINTGGDMWWNFDRAEYYVPANTQKTSMFSASLWIGGLDVNGQLKLAAQRYRQVGIDYWPGPISMIDASVDEETCAQYDKLFKITRAQVDEYLAWWNSPDRSAEFPNYTIPEDILNWPAHGDESQGQSYYLAPFYDNDGDGNYDPTQGDYPYYDIDNSLCKSQTPTMDAQYYHPDDPDNWKYGILADQVIKGDETLWWVFNDKGDVHTETSGAAIGMEIRAQSFGFATNDEINNMTFYSYEIINRSTFRLTQTYFSQWVDTDLGYAWDDYVGCDIERGLGYCYNGVSIDGSGEVEAYGEQPPAIGVDFFQGPYMDPDTSDNPSYKGDGIDGPSFFEDCNIVGFNGTEIFMTYGENNEKSGTFKVRSEAINGINFGDGIVDNERFGMRRFVYHNNSSANPNTTDPQDAPEYYNYLRGIWKDNTKMLYGGTAHEADDGAVGPETDFMFPGDTDPCNWSTRGEFPNDGYNQNGKFWTEETQNNQPGDRRFMQSAGPFTLEPGAVNYITVGIPWARASSGGAWASVLFLRVVDDKCQALFDNCFKVLDGPSAPDMTFLEMDRKLIVFLSNRKGSNNFNESYAELDPNIEFNDSIFTNPPQTPAERDSLKTYFFEGYQIFQLRSPDVTVESIHDPDLARLVAQFDKNNGITKLVNYYFDQSIGANVPVVEVEGGDEGISHTFEITTDAFADKDPKLVNNKQYYYLALAYAYNEFFPYSQEAGIENGLLGQKLPYLAGRKNIKVYTAIPHKIVNGTVLNASYGDGFSITRLQGHGNGGVELRMTESSVNELLSKPPIPYESFLTKPYGRVMVEEFLKPQTNFGDPDYPIVYYPTYEQGFGPLKIKVVDPINVISDKFTLEMFNTEIPYSIVGNDTIYDTVSFNRGKWRLIDESGNMWTSDTTMDIRNEQVIPELGISVTIEQIPFPGDSASVNNGLIISSLTYQDSAQRWLSGVPDIDVPASPLNWIRSGIYKDGNSPYNDWNMSGDNPLDPNQYYEKLITQTQTIFGEDITGGTWTPYPLVATHNNMNYGHGPAPNGGASKPLTMENTPSIDVVFTADKSLWSRCPVIEMSPDPLLAEGHATQYTVRKSPSVDKDGNFADPNAQPSMDPESPAYISPVGMGWFPGYAINVETGERLNVMFSENSWLVGDNGRDMQWNPTSTIISETSFAPVFGGMHYLYIMDHTSIQVGSGNNAFKFTYPPYDAGVKIYHALNISQDSLPLETVILPGVYKSCVYTSIPLAANDSVWLPEGNNAIVKIRVAKPYQRYYSQGLEPDNPLNMNNFNPVYEFETAGMESVEFSSEANQTDLDLITVVPNPYYAYADGPGYERNQLDTRVKIINLPEQCVVTIYNISGTLIRQYDVDKTGISNPSASTRGLETTAKTSIDWDLKNFAGIPIASGIYLIHVKETGGRYGERVIKWFGAMRPIDLNTF